MTVSVIIATYNRAEGLSRAIESVLRQSYPYYEIIVADDCSTDNTKEIVEQFNDKRIHYVKLDKNSGGAFIPRQVGLKASTGEYIAILDDDDFWVDRNKLKLQVSYLENHPECVLVGTNAVAIDKKGEVVIRIRYPQTDEKLRKKMLMRNWFYHSSVLYRRKAYLDVGGYRIVKDGHYGNFASEYEMWMAMGLHGKLTNIPIYGVGYFYFVKKLPLKTRVDFIIKHIRMITKYKDFYPNYWRYCVWSSILAIFEIPIILRLRKLWG